MNELQLHELFRFVQPDAPLTRKVHGRLGGPRRVGHEHITPAAFGRQLPDINHLVGEVLEEHTGTDVAFHTCGHHDVHDLAITLVRVREGDDGFVGGRDRSEAGHQQHRPGETHQTDAAGLHGDEFPIGRQPSETDKDPQEDGHRNRQAQGLREQQPQDAHDDRPFHTAGDELLSLGENRRDLEDEREHRKAEEERHHDLANQVPVENAKHFLETRLAP